MIRNYIFNATFEKYGSDIFQQIRNKVEDFSNLKVLVIGDVIIDEYVFCKVQGLTIKDSALSTLYDSLERYCGGVLAVVNHLANFAGQITLISQMGLEKDISSGRDFLLTKNDKQFAEYTIKLLKDTKYGAQLAQNALSCAELRFSLKAFNEIVKRSI